MIKIRPYRYWFYFRQGWATYFAFIFAAINTMVVTYYLAIKDVPILEKIFPSFIYYLLTTAIVGIPLLILIGYIHYKKIAAYHAEIDIQIESNPYYYKLPPGYWTEVLAPFYLVMANLMLKSSNNEKLTNEEINEIKELQKKLDLLIKGGYVGKLPSNMFRQQDNDF
ncbi:MAG: hypothetical protein KGI10_07315 [Thaumarchaeota archaeon]|nr:hypothetical protein [Nitrososphaerota archaeon]